MNQPSKRSKAPSILIVDDDPDIGIALTDLLEPEGYLVDVVETGGQALSSVKRQQYEVVLLDVGLPDQDGLSVLASLNELAPNLPVIILTAYTSLERSIGSLHDQGLFAYLTKPYNRDELKSCIRRALGVKALTTRAERVQHALLASEERFRSVVQSATDAIILSDQRGHIIFWNDAAHSLFGYSQDEVLGKSLTLIMPDRYRDAHQRGIERMRLFGESQLIGKTIELEGLRKDGSEFPVELSLGTWSGEDEIFYCGIIRDATMRQLAEVALQHRIEFEHLVATLSTHFLNLEPEMLDAGITRALGAIGEFAGVDRSYVFLFSEDGKTIKNTHEWCAEGILPVIQKLQRVTVESFPWALNRIKQNETLHFGSLAELPPEASAEREEFQSQHILSLLNVPMVYQSEVIGFLGFDSVRTEKSWKEEDIHLLNLAGNIVASALKRRETETALQDSEERFRQLAENIREVFWLTNPHKNHMLYISRGYEEIWGRTCESLYATPESWIEVIHPDDRDRVRNAAHTRQATGKYDEVYRIVRSDGSIRWIHDRAFPITNSAGQVYRIAGIAEDITERKIAQAAWQNAYHAMKTIFFSLPCAIVAIDNDFQVVYANSLAYQLPGLKDSLEVGKSVLSAIPISNTTWKRLTVALGKKSAADRSPDIKGVFWLQSREYQYRAFRLSGEDNEQTQIGLTIWHAGKES